MAASSVRKARPPPGCANPSPFCAQKTVYAIKNTGPSTQTRFIAGLREFELTRCSRAAAHGTGHELLERDLTRNIKRAPVSPWPELGVGPQAKISTWRVRAGLSSSSQRPQLCHEAVKQPGSRPARQPAGHAPLIQQRPCRRSCHRDACNHDWEGRVRKGKGISNPSARGASTGVLRARSDRPGKSSAVCQRRRRSATRADVRMRYEGPADRSSVLIFSPALRAASACRPRPITL